MRTGRPGDSLTLRAQQAAALAVAHALYVVVDVLAAEAAGAGLDDEALPEDDGRAALAPVTALSAARRRRNDP